MKKANGQGRADLSVQLAEFFIATAHAPGLCYFVPTSSSSSDTVGAGCPAEKDTPVGEEKGSDLGFGKCDFVEYANVA